MGMEARLEYSTSADHYLRDRRAGRPWSTRLPNHRVVADRMEGLSDFYKSEGLDKAFPQGVIDLASDKGVPYSVPVNIHRSNVIWFNKSLFAQVGADKAPATNS